MVKQSRNTEHPIGLTSEGGHGKDTFLKVLQVPFLYKGVYIDIIYLKELSRGSIKKLNKRHSDEKRLIQNEARERGYRLSSVGETAG